MIKSSQNENRRSQPCWERDFQTQALRVELADESSYVFPYTRLAFVRFEPGNDHDTVRLRSDTHEIQIVGENLRSLELALQKFAVDWVKGLSERYDLQTSDDPVRITKITVSELKE
ncbi:MAG: hypothetical protein ABSA12_11150 [Verrucomicrobiia bacterium]|jgi:hypothetical protein